MGASVRIAVLECDEPIEVVKERIGGFGRVFEELLAAGASKVAGEDCHDHAELEVSGYDVVKDQVYPDLQDVDAVLLTGSRYDSYDSGENNWILRLVDFVRAALQRQVRVMGVCFGHQIIGRTLGVMPVRSDKGWEVSVTNVSLTEKGKQLFGTDSVAVHQMHRDVVPSIPNHVERLGSSSRCEVQGMYVKNRLISMQGHPEFDATIVNTLLDRRRGNKLDDRTYRDGKSRANLPHDGVTIAAAFVRFLLDY